MSLKHFLLKPILGVERDLIVGGQAVIEGVMMRTPNAYAIAVRKADGTIINTAARLPKWSDSYPILKWPVLRGGAVLIQSMGLGIKALNYSANEAFAEVEEAKAEEVQIALSPAVIEGEGDFAGLTGAVPGLFPVPTKKRSKDELKKGTTAAAARCERSGHAERLTTTRAVCREPCALSRAGFP